MTLSSEQLRAFRERGYFNLGRVFATSAVVELGAAYDAALAKPMHIGERGPAERSSATRTPLAVARCAPRIARLAAPHSARSAR